MTIGRSFLYTFVAYDRFTDAANKVNFATQSVSEKIATLQDKVKDFGTGIYNTNKKILTHFTLPMTGLAGLALKASSNVENLKTSFVGILGTMAKAGTLTDQLNKFTAKTPFQLAQVAQSAKMLLAAGIPMGKISEKLQTIGDLASAANVPISEMAKIFAKSKNKGKAMTEELLQLSDRGIPIIAELAKMSGKSLEQVFKMAEKGVIKFKFLQKAFQRMTSKGGFANKAMILQSKTLGGLWSTFKDNIMLTGATIGDVLLPVAKSVLSFLIKVVQKIGDLFKAHPRLAQIAAIMLALVSGLSILVMALFALGFALLQIAGFAIIIKAISLAFGMLVGYTPALAIFGTKLAPIAAFFGKIFAGSLLYTIGTIGLVILLVGLLINFLLNLPKYWQAVTWSFRTGNFITRFFDDVAIKVDKLIKKIKNFKNAVKGYFGFGDESDKKGPSSGMNNRSAYDIQSPLRGKGDRDEFSGFLDINILDKNKNAGGVAFSGAGPLDVGVSRVGA